MRKEKIAIQATAMSIRELMMDYFKGGYTPKVTKGDAVQLSSKSADRRWYYTRQIHENQQPSFVMISSLPVISLQKAPDKVTFHSSMKRSSQLKEVQILVEKFLDDYLSSVEREVEDGPIC